MARLICALLALVALPALARAEDSQGAASPTPGREALLFYDVPVVVSATRTERSVRDIPNAVTVITAEEISSSGATSLVQLLATVPGLEVMRNSVADYNLSARGFNGTANSNLLVMIDGRSTYLDFFGIVIWDYLNVTLQDIERIEVIRGPGSSLYGANAFLGTVNIVTKRPEDLPTAYVRGGVGNDRGLVTATGSQSWGSSSVKASAQYRNADHFSNPNNAALNIDHRRGENGLRNNLFNATYMHQFPDGSELRLWGGMIDQRSELLTGVGTWDYEGPKWTGELAYERGPWRMRTWLTYLDFDIGTLPVLPPGPVPVPTTDRLTSTVFDFELQREISLGAHQLLVGSTARRLSTNSPNVLGSREAESLYAAFIQDEFQIREDLTAFIGARFDEHPKSDFNVSPRGGLVYKLNETSRLRASTSRSFRNPTQIGNDSSINLMGDLGGGPTTVVQVQGNEDLDPVLVTAYEAGGQTLLGSRLNLSGDVFYQVIRDFQDFSIVAPGLPTVTSFRNSGRTEAYGVELSGDLRWSDSLHGFASYSFQSAHGPFEQSTPPHKASGGIRGTLGSRLRYALTGYYVAAHDIETSSAVMLADDHVRSRFTVDGYLGIRVHPHFELGLHAQNMFNQKRSQFPQGDEIGTELLLTGTVEF